MKQIQWTGKMIAELRRLYRQHDYRRCAEIMGLPPERVKGAICRYKITCGRTGHFPKGHTSWNKGKKGVCTGGKVTQFKKGHLPQNTKHDGAISMRADGYKYIRIAKGEWVLLHRYLWGQMHGAIPEGKILVFKDGNQMNCEPGNLELLTRKQHVRRNNNTKKASKSMKALYKRERMRKKYGLSPISGHGSRIVNYY